MITFHQTAIISNDTAEIRVFLNSNNDIAFFENDEPEDSAFFFTLSKSEWATLRDFIEQELADVEGDKTPNITPKFIV